jgi:hypothetical protein
LKISTSGTRPYGGLNPVTPQNAAAVVYRSLGDFALAWCGGEASFLALPEPLQATDRAAWTQAYRAVDRAEYPHIWQVRDELPLVTDDDIFESVLAMTIAGLCQRAPRPCPCPPGEHTRPAQWGR